MNKAFLVLFAISLLVVPSYTQVMEFEEDGESLIIVNWEEFLTDPGNDNPVIEPELPIQPEEHEEDNNTVPGGEEWNVTEEVSLENEGETGEGETSEGEYGGEEIDVEQPWTEELDIIVVVPNE